MLKKLNVLSASNKRVGANKLVLGFAAIAASAMVGTTGVAAAAHQTDRPDKQDCKSAGYSNYGQCVKSWAHHKDPGHGYGGGNTVNVGVDVHGNNNVINIIIRLFQ